MSKQTIDWSKFKPIAVNPRDQLESVSQFAEILERCRELGGNTLRIDPAGVMYDRGRVRVFSKKNGRSKKRVLDSWDIAHSDAINLQKLISDRVFQWPYDSEQGMVWDANPRLRMLSAPVSGLRFVANASAVHLAGIDDLVLQLNNITWEKLPVLTEVLSLEPKDKAFFYRIGAVQNGIILCGSSSTERPVDARAVLLALRPDAIFIEGRQTIQTLTDAISLADDCLLVIHYPVDQISDMMLEFKLSLSGSGEVWRQACTHLFAAFLHLRLGKLCQNCSRKQEPLKEDLKGIAQEIIKLLPSSIYRGIGCLKCKDSGYKGTIGLTSVVDCSIAALRETLRKTQSEEELSIVLAKLSGETLLEQAMAKLSAAIVDLEGITQSKLIKVKEVEENSRKSKKQKARESAELADQAENGMQDTSPKSLLIVESDIHRRDVLEIILSQAGYNVVGTGTAGDARGILSTTKFDIVLCDATLPEVSFDELLKELETEPGVIKVPILMLSENGKQKSHANGAHKNHPIHYMQLRSAPDVILKRVAELVA